MPAAINKEPARTADERNLSMDSSPWMRRRWELGTDARWTDAPRLRLAIFAAVQRPHDNSIYFREGLRRDRPPISGAIFTRYVHEPKTSRDAGSRRLRLGNQHQSGSRIMPALLVSLCIEPDAKDDVTDVVVPAFDGSHRHRRAAGFQPDDVSDFVRRLRHEVLPSNVALIDCRDVHFLWHGVADVVRLVFPFRQRDRF